MGLFRRTKPLHEQLAQAAGVAQPPLESYLNPHLSVPAHPSPDGPWPGPVANDTTHPGRWPPDAVARPGGSPLEAYGPLSSRPWDVVTTVDAPLVGGDHLTFVTLDDGTVILDDDQPDGALIPLADGIERSIAPPYRAAAVRNHGTLWGVSAVRITLVQIPELEGDAAELIVNGSEPSLTIDGRPTHRHVEELVRAGESQGRSYVVRAARVDDDIWQVDALPL